MSWFVVDAEYDGPFPPRYSLVSIGIVKLDRELKTSLYVETRPISWESIESTRLAHGVSRERHLSFPDPARIIPLFVSWVKQNSEGHPVFVSDNPAADFPWINYYCWTYAGENPFGYSARRIGDLYAGMKGHSQAKWKQLRTTKHTHHPVDDAMGNAEALLKMIDLGLKIKVD